MNIIQSVSEKSAILELARKAFEQYILNGSEISYPSDIAVLQIPCGAFVTLKIEGELRGCIGFTDARYPLGEIIVKCAILAATRDPRFPAVQKSELALLD